MHGFSLLHWLILAFVVLLLFSNRLPRVMRSLAEEIEKAKKCQWCGRRMAIQDQACRHCRRPRIPPTELPPEQLHAGPEPADSLLSLPRMKLPRFKLRTLFVLIALVSIPLGWVAYQLNWQRQRHNFLARTHAGKLDMGLRTAPWSLKLFGESQADYLLNVADADTAEARSLFPEAIKINPQPSDFPEASAGSIGPRESPK